jgi:hypothetical protein
MEKNHLNQCPTGSVVSIHLSQIKPKKKYQCPTGYVFKHVVCDVM